MTPSRPVIFSYCATFLPREMRHVYRQISGIRQFENRVVTRKWTHVNEFPYPLVHILRKSPFRGLSRLYHRSLGRMVPVGHSETRQIKKLIFEKGAVLIHIYLGSEALRLLNFLQDCPAARVVSFHGGDLSDRYSAEQYQPLWRSAERFLCRSESLKQSLLARGCPEDKIRLNHTGIPVPTTEIQRDIFVQGAGRTLRLLQACRFIRKKGLEISMAAVKCLKDRGFPVKLTLAGEGPQEQALRRLAAELDIANDVHFAGFLSEQELRSAFGSHDVFIHPSRLTAEGDKEGIPNSLLEAMACGMPVISTRHSGIPEVITNGETGLLIDEGNSEMLADAILTLANNPVISQAIARNGAQLVQTRFSIARCIENLETIYTETVRCRSKASEEPQ